MTKLIQQAFGLALMFFSMALFAQSDRPSCVMLKSLDLKPLLGADHDAPVAFGTESKSPGKLLVFAMFDQPPGGAKNWLGAPLGDAGVKQLQQLTQASLDKLP